MLLGLYTQAISSIFTSDSHIISLLTPLYPFISIQLCFDALQGVMGGILKGCAKQEYSAMVNLFGYYVVGIPIACGLLYGKVKFNGLLSLVGHDDNDNESEDINTVMSLLVGIIGGVLSTCVLFMLQILKMDWRKESEEAVKRCEK